MKFFLINCLLSFMIIAATNAFRFGAGWRNGGYIALQTAKQLKLERNLQGEFNPETDEQRIRQLEAEQGLFKEGDFQFENDTDSSNDVISPKESSIHQKTTVSYKFDDGLGDDARNAVTAACKYLRQNTCIKCIPVDADASINFKTGETCYTNFNANGEGKSDIHIGPDCQYKGSVLHQMMHAFGFFHEHTRTDRDQHITVQQGAIKEGKQSYFSAYSTPKLTKATYDFDSIMHFPKNAFSADGSPTITVDQDIIIGQREYLSELDIKKISDAFNCTQDSQYTVESDDQNGSNTVETENQNGNNTVETENQNGNNTVETENKNGNNTVETENQNGNNTVETENTNGNNTVETENTNGNNTVETENQNGNNKVETENQNGNNTVETENQNGNNKVETENQNGDNAVETANQNGDNAVETENQNGDNAVETANQSCEGAQCEITTGNTSPTQQQTLESSQNPCCQPASTSGTYPTWPNDFDWNTNGMPDSCNCAHCGCQCVQVNEPSAGVEWSGNYICHKKTKISPRIEWSHKGPLRGRRCTHVSDPTFGKYWHNNFICVPKNSPYHFAWSSKGPLDRRIFSCLKMDIQGGPNEWQDNYLCARRIKPFA